MTQTRLKEVVKYCPCSGIFMWVARPSPRVKRDTVGQLAGSYDNKGYLIIGLDGKQHKAHRLAWLYMYGYEATEFIDHIDGNPANNALWNLRLSDYRTNGQNRKEHRQGHLVGASRASRGNKWCAQLTINGRCRHIGTFDTELEAHEAYLKKLDEIRKNE